MSYALYERKDNVGVVTLNRPERLNAMSGDLMRDFIAVLETAFADEQTGAIVLTGNGRAFCSGDDLKEFDLQTESDEAVVNHVSGHKAGVAGVYNRATYAREKREALALWGQHVATLVAGEPPKVVPIRRATA